MTVQSEDLDSFLVSNDFTTVAVARYQLDTSSILQAASMGCHVAAKSAPPIEVALTVRKFTTAIELSVIRSASVAVHRVPGAPYGSRFPLVASNFLNANFSATTKVTFDAFGTI